MDVDALRARAQAVMFSTLGVPITITRPLADDGPVTTTGIWMALPLAEAQPVGTDLRRREARKIMAIQRDTVITQIPRGTVILAPELIGGNARTWRVDGYDRVEPDEFRVNLVPTTEVL